MRRNFGFAVLVAVLSAIFSLSLPAFAQTGTVEGSCKDAQGQPITDAQVVWQNQDNGRSYKLKTDKKGKFFSLGIEPGPYTVTLSKDGKVLDTQKNVHVGLDEVTYDINLKQIQQQNIQATAKQTGMTAEQVKKMQEENAKATAYNANIKAVNLQLQQASALEKAQPPNYDQAISILQQCTQEVPDEDVVWYRLGSAYLQSARMQTDAAEKTKRYTEAMNDIQKAIDLKKNKDQAGTASKKPEDQATDNQRLAAYYSDFGAAAAGVSKTEQAADSYKQAASLDPTHAGNYYFNLGAVLTNTATTPDAKKAAADAFDKAIAADPSKADAYYWKGSNLIALASADSSGKLTAPPGTEEAFQKYLELQPNGPHAAEAKQMLAVLTSNVSSSYGTKRGEKKK